VFSRFFVTKNIAKPPEGVRAKRQQLTPKNLREKKGRKTAAPEEQKCPQPP
jgi:hypothetical protein